MKNVDFMSLLEHRPRTLGLSMPGVYIPKMKMLIIRVFIIAGIISILGASSSSRPTSAHQLMAALVLILIPIGCALFVFISKNNQKFEESFKQFIVDNNFKSGLQLEIKPNSQPFVYGSGYRNTMGLEFSGTINNTNFDNFVYTYYVPTKNSERAYPFTIMHLSLNKSLPHLLLDSRKNDGIISSVPRYFSDKQRIELEGYFNEYFDFYAPEGYEVEALDILSPDFMQMLIDFHTDFDVEIDDHSVYIISKGADYDQQSMSELFTAAQAIIDKLDQKLQVWSMTAMEKQLPELESFSDEKAVRIGNKRISSIYFLAPIMVVGIYLGVRSLQTGTSSDWIWNVYVLFAAAVVGAYVYSRNKNKKQS